METARNLHSCRTCRVSADSALQIYSPPPCSKLLKTSSPSELPPQTPPPLPPLSSPSLASLTTAARYYVASSPPFRRYHFRSLRCMRPTPTPPPPLICSLRASFHDRFSYSTIPSLPYWHTNYAIECGFPDLLMSTCKCPFANGLSVTAPPPPVFTAGATAPQLYQFICGKYVEDKVFIFLAWTNCAGSPMAIPILLRRNTHSFMLAPVEPGNTDTSKNQGANTLVEKEPLLSLFQLPIFTKLFASFVFVCLVIVDLWPHVRDLAIAGITISSACSSMKALLGSGIAGRCIRRCTASIRQYLAVSNGMRGMSLCNIKCAHLRQLHTNITVHLSRSLYKICNTCFSMCCIIRSACTCQSK